VTAGPVAKRTYRLAARAAARDERRKSILDAAYEAFGARRYEDVTLAEVAARAGTSERTVYRLFGTKQRLLSSWLQEVAPAIGPPPDPSLRSDSRAFVRVMVDFYEHRGASILNMLAQEDSVPELRPLLDWGRDRYDEGIERGLGHLLRGFRGAARKRRHMQLVVICDVYTWSLLRQGRKLTQAEVERVLEDMLNLLEGSCRGAAASGATTPGDDAGASDPKPRQAAASAPKPRAAPRPKRA
jgi:AcrR family transcriptional regulator